MIYVVRTKKPVEELLANLPLKNIVELQMNVEVIKNIKDENYLKQLNGYKEYIKGKLNKDVNIYLYSILDESVEKINV